MRKLEKKQTKQLKLLRKLLPLHFNTRTITSSLFCLPPPAEIFQKKFKKKFIFFHFISCFTSYQMTNIPKLKKNIFVSHMLCCVVSPWDLEYVFPSPISAIGVFIVNGNADLFFNFKTKFFFFFFGFNQHGYAFLSN